MKIIILPILIVILSFRVSAQTEFRNLSFEEALDQAKTEQKLLFVDCYTSWCGPCKMMANTILNQPELGKFMNEHFVCVKYDLEKGEGPALAQKYEVSVYPTFLLLQPDGRVQHKIIGGSETVEAFQQAVEQGLKEETANGRLENLYLAGNRDLDLMTRYIQSLLNLYEIQKAGRVSAELLGSLEDEERTTASYWFIYEHADLTPVGSVNMNFLLAHLELFIKNNGQEKVNRKLSAVYETRLVDILRGKDKTSGLEDVIKIVQSLQPYDLPGKELLNDYISLVKTRLTGTPEQQLTECERVFPKLAEAQWEAIYFNIASKLQPSLDKAQRKRLIVLSEKLRAGMKNERFIPAMDQFISSELKKR